MIPGSRRRRYSGVREHGSAWTGGCAGVHRESEGAGIGALLQKERGLIAGVLANEGFVTGGASEVNPRADGETLGGGDNVRRNIGVAAASAGKTQRKRSHDSFGPTRTSHQGGVIAAGGVVSNRAGPFVKRDIANRIWQL